MRKNEKGFSAVEGLLIVLVLAVIGFGGYYVWHTQKKADKVNSSATAATSSNTAKTTTQSDKDGTAAAQQQTPQAFVKAVLASLNTGNETQLEQYLSPSFKAFRQTNLSTYPCNNTTNTNLGSDTKVLALFCGSLLDPAKVTPLTPVVSDFTFKDGQKGKSVDYQIAQTTGDTGITYFTFKLLPNGNTWLLNDYGDVFVGTGSTVASPLLGERELTQ